MSNSIRAAILAGNEGARPKGLIAKKSKRPPAAAEEASLAEIPVKRDEARRVDQRADERHPRLIDRALIVRRGREIEVSVVNISPGGAMVETLDLKPAIGELLELRLADCTPAKCTVCWLKGCRIGLRFTHETTIDGPADVQDFIIRTLRGSEQGAEEPGRVQVARPRRYRLIWQASLHYEHESTPARVRNISAEGAMIECGWDFHAGTEVMLDLEEAGTVFARVRWCEGGQIGLQFNDRFDLRLLAACKPAPARSVRAHPAPGAGQPSRRRISIRRGARLSVSQLAELFRKRPGH